MLSAPPILRLGHPEKTVAVMLGDGELETASALASLNLVKLAGSHAHNGRVIPILHLNGYKISAPTLYGRKSEREMKEFVRGFGYTPLWIEGDSPEAFQKALKEAAKVEHPFLILKTEKGATGKKSLMAKKSPATISHIKSPFRMQKPTPKNLKHSAVGSKAMNFPKFLTQRKDLLYD